MCRHENWLNLAIKVAESSEYEKWRTGAVIVRGGSVLSVGVNKLKNSPKDKEHIPSVHAEIDAATRAGNLKGATVYVARITPGGNLGLAKPCQTCEDYLTRAEIKEVRWTS